MSKTEEIIAQIAEKKTQLKPLQDEYRQMRERSGFLSQEIGRISLDIETLVRDLHKELGLDDY